MPKKRRSYSQDEYYPPSRPIETDEGLKARSRRGDFGKNWWGKKWIEALERLVDVGRLSRGRSYARRGQVLSIDEMRSGIEARVQGSRPTPYKVTIQLAVLSDEQWEMVYSVLAEQAVFAAQLLAGEMPNDIESAFSAAGVSLFPIRSKDLLTHCTCPDWANPCKHIAAAHYILGERFDEEPFLLFRLRGKNQEQILAALRSLRTAQGEQDAPEAESPEIEEPETAPALEDSLQNFWEAGPGLAEFSVSIQPPRVEMPLLKRLGEPAFMGEPGLLSLLEPVYRAIQKAAQKAASGEEED